MASIYNLFKSVAFKVDAEVAHIGAIKTLSTFPLVMSEMFKGPALSTEDRYALNIGNLKWKFPLGLAAGLDKNAEAIDFFTALYFGAVEVGTVTPLAQVGNPKPRLFRYPDKKSLRNCMGFNNAGAEEVYSNVLSANKNGKILGVNLGKNKLTPQEKALEDYQILYEKFANTADYLVLNLSSPNTPGLRDLQQSDSLRELLISLDDLRKKIPVPLFLKISPDISPLDLPQIIDVVKEKNLNGIIATNTTIIEEMGVGGVSGQLLKEKSQIIRNKALEILKETPEIELIGVGGVSEFSDLVNFWKHGGKVMQIYTSFIFKGPFVLQEIQKDIEKNLIHNKVENLQEFVTNIEQMNIIS